MQPPLLPAETLARVLRLARLDGTVILILSGTFTLATAAGGNRLETMIGLLVAGAGAFELHGAGLLKAGEIRGIRWLVASQFYLLAAVMRYVAWRLLSYDPAIINLILTDTVRQSYVDAGLTPGQIDRIVEWSYYVSYGLIGLMTFFYQGGMAIYYLRRRSAVAQALAEA